MSGSRPLSRAEEVRRRREAQEAKRQQLATQRAYRPMPPVTVRGVVNMPTRPQPRGNNRRFFHTVGDALMPYAPEQTRRGPSILPEGWTMRRVLNYLILILIGAAAYYVWTAPTFHVTAPQILGATRIDPAAIAAALDIDGESILLVRPDELATKVRLTFPELASAEVTIGLPNQVRVRVTEREPVIFWQQGDGYTWVDESGVAFRPHGQVDGLLLVTALAAPPGGVAPADDPLSPPPYVAPDLVKAIQTLAPSAPPGSPLVYHPEHGLGWNDAQGWQVFFGVKSHDMRLKLEVYDSLVISLTGQNIYPAFISVEHPDAPYYRMAE